MTVQPALLADLVRIAGRRWVLTGRVDCAPYAYDAGTVEAVPETVVLPSHRDQIPGILAACHRHRVPVVTRGAGTCLSGGPVAIHGGVVLTLTRVNRILALDPAAGVAIVEPGVINADLQKAAGRYGLGFMPDPSSLGISTLGGNAAENAGGPRAVKYGVMRRHVLGVEFALADGTLLTSGNLGGVPYPDLPRPSLELAGLLIGSEGTLGVITRLALRLMRLPRQTATMLAFFATAEQAGEAVSRLVTSGLVPSAAEIMGELDIRLADQHLNLGLPAGAGAMLLVEVDGPGPGLTRQIAQAAGLATAAGALHVETGTDHAHRERLWLARRASTGLYGKVRPASLAGDVTVPPGRIGAMFRKIAELGRVSGLPIGVVGHAGDGNLHPAVLFDPRDPAETGQAHAVDRALVAEALRLGGSITGEHGVGIEKLGFMQQAFAPPALQFFGAVKRAFDPAGLLNPGKAVPSTAAPDRARGAAGASAATACRKHLPTQLADLLGRRLVVDQGELAAYGFAAGRRPIALALPENVEQLAAVVRAAGAASVPIWPVGGGGLIQTAFGPFEGGLAVSTAVMDEIRDISPGDLTCVVQTGAKAAALDAELLKVSGGDGKRLVYPIDPWRTPESTLGGEIATNACGPGRPRYGATRDRVLGLTFVDAAGEVCRVGARTLKDVAGYDVSRLLCGSWGALGIVAEATLRLEPAPETELTLLIEPESRETAALFALAEGLRRDVDVVGLHLLAPDPEGAIGSPPRWRLLVGLAGQSEDVAWWRDIVRAHASQAGLGLVELDAAAAAGVWNKARRLQALALPRAWVRDSRAWVTAYVTVPPVEVGSAAGQVFERLNRPGLRAVVSASWPLGVIELGVRADGQGEVTDAVSALAAVHAGSGAGLAVCGWSHDLEQDFGNTAPGRGPGIADLRSRLKQELDPLGLLAPSSRLFR